MAKREIESENQKIEIVDIWSTSYITCLKGYLKEIKKIDGKTLYRSIIQGKLYFLTDSRYGKDYYL